MSTSVRALARSLIRDHQGASAVEFAMVIPFFILTMVGALNLCQMAFTTVSLHFAVQDAARCASIKTTVCHDTASTAAYASTRYLGPRVSPTFTPTTAACGNQVVGTVNYAIDMGLTKQTVPITASACFP